MDKKEAKTQYLRKQLEDPNISEFEKQLIKQRLGIETVYSEDDFISKQGYKLLSFVYSYLCDQLPIIRRKKRTNSPFDFFTDKQKNVYYLSSFDSILEEDTLEQLYDNDDSDDIKGLVEGFKIIGRISDSELLESVLKNGKITRITDKKIKQLLDHFQDNDEIETEIEKFIRANIKEILDLQNLE